MPIDIDQLTQAELLDLNHRVVARLKFLQQLQAHRTMLDFRIGERVRFYPRGKAPVEGMITKYNRTTVTVVSEDGHRWNVAPQVLERIAPGATVTPEGSNVIALPPRGGKMTGR